MLQVRPVNIDNKGRLSSIAPEGLYVVESEGGFTLDHKVFERLIPYEEDASITFPLESMIKKVGIVILLTAVSIGSLINMINGEGITVIGPVMIPGIGAIIAIWYLFSKRQVVAVIRMDGKTYSTGPIGANQAARIREIWNGRETYNALKHTHEVQ